jgi:hypothetical protein
MMNMTTGTGHPGRQRIDIEDDDEIRNWCRAFSVTPTELKAAVAAVGTVAVDVERYILRRQKR